MAANMSVMQRLQRAWKQLDSLFLRWTGTQNQFMPALVGCPVVPVETDTIPSDNSSFLSELLGGNGIMWISRQTARSRRSREKRQTRRFGYSFIQKRQKIHKDIISCLRCGSFHKLNTLCGDHFGTWVSCLLQNTNVIKPFSMKVKYILESIFCEAHYKVLTGACYDKVRQETNEMMKKMGDHLEYEAPHSEVAVIYEGEEAEQDKLRDKFIVQMDKPRPQWFSDIIDIDKKKKKWLVNRDENIEKQSKD